MGNPEQLARIAALRPQVAIYRLNRAYEVWQWLCPKHLAARLDDGWDVKERKNPPHELRCDDINRGPCG